MDRYEKMTDEQLIQELRGGDNKIVDYIMEKYKNLVRKEANAMYLLGGENEDLLKQCRIMSRIRTVHFSASQNYVFPGSFILLLKLPGERNTVL